MGIFWRAEVITLCFDRLRLRRGLKSQVVGIGIMSRCVSGLTLT